MKVGCASGSSCRTMNTTRLWETDLETLRDFTSVSSDFYSGFSCTNPRTIEEWYLARECEEDRLKH
jgi:hypothetical protein